MVNWYKYSSERKNISNAVLTRKEMEVINKKIYGGKLTQQDSNRLSKSVRPKLRAISSLDAGLLLDKLKYNQKAVSIETKIKKTVLKYLKNVDSIILYGSAIQTNWKNYNDIDVLVIVNNRFWRALGEKYLKILEIKNTLKRGGIHIDLRVYDKKTFETFYPSNISLIYQLKDKKILYGKLKLPLKIEVPKLELRMKVDYSFLEGSATSIEIYKAIRNILLVKLLLQRIVDNEELMRLGNREVGESILNKLKKNEESKIERKIALLHLQRLISSVLSDINHAKWEKIVLLNH